MSESTIHIILAGSELAGDIFLLAGCAAVVALLIADILRARRQTRKSQPDMGEQKTEV
jgi:hypothetical protein